MFVAGNRLKELRESLDYTPDQFAKILGVHRSSIYRYEGKNEKEKRELPISVAITLAEKYNISLDWLAGASEEKYIKREFNNMIEIYNLLSDDGKRELYNFAIYIKSKEGL